MPAFSAPLFANSSSERLDLVTLTLGWPAWLRLLVRLVADNLGMIFFILLLVVTRAGMQAATPLPARTYLVGVAASLATAWVVIIASHRA